MHTGAPSVMKLENHNKSDRRRMKSLAA